MVHHFPDTAADEVVVVIDLLPVGLCVAGADAHGVGVLAHEVGAVVHRGLFAPVLADVMQFADRWVHVGADVVGDPRAVDGALVVDRQGGDGLQVVVHRVRVMVAAGLVAEGPHDDGRVRVDLVPLIHALDALHVPGQPLRVVGDGVVVAGFAQLHDRGGVGLEVVLVDDVDAQLIREFEEQRVRGVVGRADRVDVELLAEEQIALDVVRGHRVAVRAGRVVVVDALELDLLPVDEEEVFFDLDGLEPDALLDAGRLRLIVNVVKGRVFGVPFGDVEVFEGGGRCPADDAHSLCLLEAVAFEGERDVGVPAGGGGEGQGVLVPGLLRDGVDVLDVRGLIDAEQYIAEDAVVAEHVLVLKVRAGAPAVDDGQQLVLALHQFVGEVELGGVVRAFGVSDELAVQVEVQAARDTEERDDIVLVRVLDGDAAAIHAHKVVLLTGVHGPRADALVRAQDVEELSDLFGLRDAGRVEGELVPDVHVERSVIAPELPAGGDVDGVEGHGIGVELGREFRWSRVELEVPVAVQAQDFL